MEHVLQVFTAARLTKLWQQSGWVISLGGIFFSLSSPVLAQGRIYLPIPIQPGATINDRLSIQDIPTGQGGFARDYVITLAAGDQVLVELASSEFDTIVQVFSSEGSTVGENDDGPDGSTNSLLFLRVAKAGVYIVRVRAFGETAGGSFRLKVTRLKPA